ncbi:MAG: hypothetical protein AAF899_03920 [Pseudomonadota bacterium]
MRLFTWNLQRRRTIDPAKGSNAAERHAAAVRRDLLRALCRQSAFGFITEPGLDLRRAEKGGYVISALLPDGNFMGDERDDGQSDGHACKAMLFAKRRSFTLIETSAGSGARLRQRFPAARLFSNGSRSMLAAALHATSGRGGLDNAETLITELTAIVEDEKINGLIVGGDFNAHLTDEDDRSFFWMPSKPTNQGAGSRGVGIDGFYFFSCGTAASPMLFSAKAPQRYDDVDARYGFRVDAEAKGGKVSGFFHIVPGAGQRARVETKLSDHAPVIIDITTRFAGG